jgi:uncharacterized membrane protein
MRNEKVRDMAYYAVFVAIITIMTFVPSLGYITLGGISITILHVIVLLAAFTMGKKGGLVAGLAMGILCMLKAWIAPGSIYDYPFRNPLCAVLPRALFGFIAGLIAEIITKKTSNKALSTTLVVVASVLLTAFHSVVTVPLLYLCATWVPELKEWCASNELLIFFGATFVGNSIFEMAVAGVATAPIILVLRPIYLRGRKKK